MDLSIIIVNWNSAAFAQECIASVRESVRELEYEVTVVDNASTDDSADVLEAVPAIRMIRSASNVGFGRANNLGFECSTGKSVLFLNPDTKVLGDAIDRTVKALLDTPSAGIVGCRLLNGDMTVQTSCIQTFPTILNQLTDFERVRLRFPHIRMFGIGPLFDTDSNPITRVEAVSGAYLLIRRDLFEQVGMFSSDYFMYAEDLDLCYKVARLGWQVCFVSDAAVIHYGGQSSKKKDNGFGDVLTRQAIYQFLAKTRGTAYAMTYRVAMSFAALARMAIAGAFALASFDTDRRPQLRSVVRKWARIFRWTVGMEAWAARMNPAQPPKIQIPTA
jgi:GT2 family glycosyltransferase